MSNDTDTRVVATRRDGGTAASFNADTLVTFANTATIDTHSGWINSSEYKISVSGVYKISALFLTTAAPLGVTGAFQVYYRVNNGTSFRLGYVTGNGNSAEYSAGGSDSVSLNAGDLITFRVTSSSTHTLSAAACKVSIERLSGPATIAASETVAARYTSSAGNAVTNAVLNYIDFATKDYDTHNMVTVSTATPKNTTVTNTGWKAIIPVSGKYKIFSNATSDAGGAWAAGEEWSVIIVKNGVELATSPNISTSTHSTYMNGLGSAVLNLGAGDRIEIGIYQNSGSSINLSSNPKIIYVEIYRIGN
jgi:plastocyanin